MKAEDAPRRGEVYVVGLPGHPHDSKRRPAIVVSLDARNRWANDVIVVPVSTTQRPAPTHVSLPAGAGGLRKPSTAKCEQVTTLDKSFLSSLPLGGTLHSELMREIERAILRAIGVPVP